MPTPAPHPDLFGEDEPCGFRYRDDVLSAGYAATLVDAFQAFSWRAFQFHGFEGNRRTVSFGWRYDYAARKALPADPFPPVFNDLRVLAAEMSGHAPDAFEQILATEYAPGAAIGWHRDKPEFGDVVGFSFVSPCKLRFRREHGERWERRSRTVLPRSAYLLSGPARWEWQHSIPAQTALRYSVTLRTLRASPPTVRRT